MRVSLASLFQPKALRRCAQVDEQMLAGFGKAILGCRRTAKQPPAACSHQGHLSRWGLGGEQQRKPENQAWGLTLRRLRRGRLPLGPPGSGDAPWAPQATARQRLRLLLRAPMVGSADCVPVQRENASPGAGFIKHLLQGGMISRLGTVCGLRLAPPLPPAAVGSLGSTVLPCPSSAPASPPPLHQVLWHRGDSQGHQP